jgi:hypothetical protein
VGAKREGASYQVVPASLSNDARESSLAVSRARISGGAHQMHRAGMASAPRRCIRPAAPRTQKPPEEGLRRAVFHEVLL